MPAGNRFLDSFGTNTALRTGGSGEIRYFSLPALAKRGMGGISRLPWSMRIVLENLLRHEDGIQVKAADIEAVARGNAGKTGQEISFMPARVLLQDLTGVPVLVDLAAMRDAASAMGGDPSLINPAIPVDLVIDHSIQADFAGAPGSMERNLDLEYSRNRERYTLMRWGQRSFSNMRVVPPANGICHQVNLEHLASVVATRPRAGTTLAFPDSVIGTDSHTTMINGLGVIGWGAGGIEAEAAMLGQPVSMTVPRVVGVRLSGRIPSGATITDAVLTITQILRKKGVVGKFVEFFGEGAAEMSIPDRATIANMAPEYGATMGFFPPDRATIDYLALTGRSPDGISLAREYLEAQGLLKEPGGPEPDYDETVDIDLSAVVPCVAGPRRPQDRVPLGDMKRVFHQALLAGRKEGGFGVAPAETGREVAVHTRGREGIIRHGSVVIASITSCTSTSNPAAMIAAGLLARNAAQKGLCVPPTVKTTLSPGSRVVADYLGSAGLLEPLEKLGFGVAGYGCMTCIGNSGPLDEPVAAAVKEGGIIASAVLSGNRNFEGRIHPLARASYLASPPLVVAFALAGTADIDLNTEPLGRDRGGNPVFLRDIWPSPDEVSSTAAGAVKPAMFHSRYAAAFTGDGRWQALPTPEGALFAWEPSSSYIKRPPFLEQIPDTPVPGGDIHGARALAVLGDSVTTDHISPAGSIPADGPAGRHLAGSGFAPRDFNSFGSRRGNHEIMMRGTFANIRLTNLLAPGTEGGWTLHLPDGKKMSIFEASAAYRQAGIPLIVIAGREYGTGSSRDWAAKGPALLGVRAVLAASFERIHRSNLIQMGVLPMEFLRGQDREALGLDGHEEFNITGISGGIAPRSRLKVEASKPGGKPVSFEMLARVDTAVESEYLRHGGILPFVLRKLCGKE